MHTDQRTSAKTSGMGDKKDVIYLFIFGGEGELKIFYKA